jgi:hypothetical protein
MATMRLAADGLAVSMPADGRRRRDEARLRANVAAQRLVHQQNGFSALVLCIWDQLMNEFCIQAPQGKRRLFILLERDPARELIQLRALLGEDRFTHLITGHLAEVDGQTGYGASLVW